MQRNADPNIPSGYKPVAYNVSTPTVDRHLSSIDKALLVLQNSVNISKSTTFVVPTASSGGATTDTQARTDIAAIIANLALIKTALQAHNIIL